MARQKRRTIHLEEGWAFMQKGITKLKNILEGKPEPQLSCKEDTMLYTTIYDMCTQKPPHDYSQQLYDKYRESIEEYITSVVLPSLSKKHDELMLRELVLRWSNIKLMVKWLSRFFHYLERSFIPRRLLTPLKEVGLTCFRELIYQEFKGQIKDAVIALIKKEREGEQIDRALLKNVLGIFVEIGLGQMDCYENDFEDFLLKDTTEYYSVKAQSWILKDSFRDCMIKAEECLKREKERVGHYLHISSEQKLLEDVTNEGTALVKQAEDSAIYKKPEKKDMVGMQEQVSLWKIFKQLGKSTLTGWADIPAELLAAIFSRLPDSTYQSRVCVQWLRADLMLQRPVLWRPVQVDSLPEDSLLVPIDKACAPPNNLVVQLSPDHADIEPIYRYSYSVAPGPTLDSDLRFVGGTSGSPLFVDDRQRCLVVLRLSHLPGAKGSSAEATVLRIPLPEGVEPLDIDIGCMAVSSSRTGSKNWLPAGITSVLVVTRSGLLLGVRGEHRSRWSRIGTTETANRTFDSILLSKQPDGESGCNDATTCVTDSYILLDNSMRLVMVSLSLSSDATVMNLQEMPVEGGIQNLLLQSDLRARWLLYLPKSDHSGDDIIVCLAYRQFNHLCGCFVAYDLVEDTPRHWVKRVSISTGYCVFISWGTGAAAFGYPFPLRVGLMSRRIYDCQNGLKSYSLGLNYANSHGILPPVTPLRWPFSLWMVPAFPPCLQVGDDTRKPVNREDAQPEKRDLVGMQEQPDSNAKPSRRG